MSFRARLAATYAAIFAVSFCILAAGVYASLDRVLRAQLDESLRTIARYHQTVWPQTFPGVDDGKKLGPCVFYLDPGGKVLYQSVLAPPPVPADAPAFEASASGEDVFTRVSTPNGPLRVMITRVSGENGATHVLEVATPLAPIEEALRTVLAIIAGLALAALAAALAAGRWLAARAIGPVEAVTTAARAIHATDLRTRLPEPPRHDEIGELVAVFNQMLARLDEAFAAQRRFTADASHELRSPLTALRGELEVAARRERSPEHYQQVLASALEEVARIERILDDLLELARLDEGTAAGESLVDLPALAAGVVARHRADAESRGLALELQVEPGVFARGVPARLERALANLVGNALRYTRAGRVEVVVRARPDTALIEVRDTGVGIPADQLERVFDRFQRLDASRAREAGGIGLGLAIARQIARVHGGDLTVASTLGEGSTFSLSLPRASATARAGKAAPLVAVRD